MNRFKSKIPEKKKANEDMTADKWYQNLKAENIIPSLHPIEEYASEYKHQHKPWYMLTKNELKEIWKNRQIQPKKGKDYFDWIVEEKIAKWERKHPKPSDDLFKEEFMLNWNKEREEELTRIRDVVISQYDKTTRLNLMGRYQLSDGRWNTESKYVDKKITEIRDENLEFEKTEEVIKLNPGISQTIKNAQMKTNREFKRSPNLICTSIINREGTKKRILIPSTKVWTKHGICA